MISVVFSYLLAYLYVSIFIFGSTSAGMYQVYATCFTLGFLIWGECMGRKKGVKVRESYLWFAITVLISLSFFRKDGLMYENGIAEFFSYAVMHMVAIYFVLSRMGYQVLGKISGYFLWEMFYGGILLPFGNFFLRTSILWDRWKKRKVVEEETQEQIEERQNNIGIGILVGCASFLLFIIVLTLLISSDARFASSIDHLFDFSWIESIVNMQVIFQFFVSLPVGGFFFGLIYGAYQGNISPIEKSAAEATMARMRVVPNKMLLFPLSAFCGVYGFYIYLQLEYFVSALMGILPEEFTYAEYARQGFFELCMIMAINLSMICMLAKLGRVRIHTDFKLKSLVILFLAESIFFAFSAFTKLLFYISAYGFTALRVLSTWWVVVLTMAVMAALISLLTQRKVIDKLLYFAVLSFTIICFL